MHNNPIRRPLPKPKRPRHPLLPIRSAASLPRRRGRPRNPPSEPAPQAGGAADAGAAAKGAGAEGAAAEGTTRPSRRRARPEPKPRRMTKAEAKAYATFMEEGPPGLTAPMPRGPIIKAPGPGAGPVPGGGGGAGPEEERPKPQAEAAAEPGEPSG
jgi:hypothetical protein